MDCSAAGLAAAATPTEYNHNDGKSPCSHVCLSWIDVMAGEYQ
jgi:hypothetical protein